MGDRRAGEFRAPRPLKRRFITENPFVILHLRNLNAVSRAKSWQKISHLVTSSDFGWFKFCPLLIGSRPTNPVEHAKGWGTLKNSVKSIYHKNSNKASYENECMQLVWTVIDWSWWNIQIVFVCFINYPPKTFIASLPQKFMLTGRKIQKFLSTFFWEESLVTLFNICKIAANII